MANTGLPGTKLVCLYSIAECSNVVVELKRYFDAKGGYEVDCRQSVTIEELRNLPKCSVFCFVSHGLSADGAYALVTDVPDTDENVGTYRSLLVSGHLVRTMSDKLAVTEAFIAEHWRFEKDSFVFIHACSSFAEQYGNFKDILKKNGKAAVVGGWTAGCTGDGDLALYFLFDRLLGSNCMEYREHPPQRPFDWQSVFENIKDRKMTPAWDRHLNVWSELCIEPGNGGNFGLLAPGIHHLEIDEETRQLTLIGMFDQLPLRTKVFVKECQTGDLPGDAYELQVESATDSEIVCSSLPHRGRGAAGYVVVAVDLKADKLLQSNPVPMTMWEGTFTYKIKKPDTSAASGQCEDTTIGSITADVSIRGDVHKVREKPGGPVKRRPTGCETIRDADKRIRYESRGTYKGIEPKYSYEWNGSGPLLPGYTKDGMGFAQVTIAYYESKPKMTVNMLTGWNEAVMTVRNEKNEIIIENATAPINVVYLASALHGNDIYMMDFLRSSVSWEQNYDIPAQEPICSPISYPIASSDKGFTAELSWTALKADYPPDEETPS